MFLRSNFNSILKFLFGPCKLRGRYVYIESLIQLSSSADVQYPVLQLISRGIAVSFSRGTGPGVY